MGPRKAGAISPRGTRECRGGGAGTARAPCGDGLPSVLAAPASASIQFDQQWGSLGILNGQFSLPNRVAADSSGGVYATDTGNDRVQKFSSTGTFITKWGSLGTGDGRFLSEQGIATDTAGNVYVVDGQANRVQKFSSSGTFITKWGSLGTGNSQFNAPQGIATDSSDDVYVADSGNARIQKFDSSGTFITKWGSVGTGDGQFSLRPGSPPIPPATSMSPTQATRGSRNSTPRASSSPSGEALGTGDGQFGASANLDVATGSAGNVIVADTFNNRIEKFRPSGTFITKWGSLGTGAGQFTSPAGVATDSSDNVYVVDQGNSRIEEFHETDATEPDTTIDSGPSGVSNADVSFTFSSSEPQLLGFECRLDSTPRTGRAARLPKAYSNLSEGSHTFEVRAVDSAGNPDTSPATRTWTVDLTAPQTTIDSGPTGPTNDASPSFGFSSEPGASFECRLDSSQEADFQPCSSPQPYSSLADGSHTFEVRATDSVGNTDPTPAAHSFTVDTAAPQTQIDSGPSGPDQRRIAVVRVLLRRGGELRVSPRLEPGGRLPALQLAAALQLAGRRLPHVRGPGHRHGGQHRPDPGRAQLHGRHGRAQTQINSGPSGPTKDATPTFGFSSEPGASFECQLDGRRLRRPCSSPQSYSLADGPHTFQVRAIDQAGNADPTPSARSFTVDTVAPMTQINAGPSGPTKDATPTFGFSSGPGASFQCKLDGGAYAPCSSPKSYSPLPNGPHTFRVRAIDAASNIDPTPSARSFTVDTVRPNTAIIGGPSGGPSPHLTVDPTPSFTFSSSQAHSSFECKLGSTPMRPALRRGPPRTWRTATTGSTSAPPIRPATSTRRRPRSASPSRPPASS